MFYFVVVETKEFEIFDGICSSLAYWLFVMDFKECFALASFSIWINMSTLSFVLVYNFMFDWCRNGSFFLPQGRTGFCFIKVSFSLEKI